MPLYKLRELVSKSLMQLCLSTVFVAAWHPDGAYIRE